MTYRGVCTSDRAGITSGNNTTVTLTFPAGTSVGDVCVAVVDLNSGSATVTAACGSNTWTASRGPDNQSNVILAYLFERTLDATDVAAGAVTFTWSTGGRPQAMGDVFYGVTVTSDAQAQAAAASLTLPSVTTTTDGSDVAALVLTRVISGTAATVTLPAGFTKDGTSSSAYASGANINAVASHLTSPGAAGSYGGGTITTSPSASHMLAYTVALAPTATSTSVSLTGVVAAATSAAIAGVVAAVQMLGLTGTPAASTSSAPAGTVVAQQRAPLTGATAQATAAAVAGAVTAQQRVDLTGATAQSTAGVAPGTVTAQQRAILSGAVAQATSSTPAGTVSTSAGSASVTLTGVTPASTSTAVAGSVVAVRVATLTGALATSTSSTPAGAVLAAQLVAVDGSTAASTSDAPTGDVVAVQVVDLTGDTAAAMSDAIPGVLHVTGGDDGRPVPNPRLTLDGTGATLTLDPAGELHLDHPTITLEVA